MKIRLSGKVWHDPKPTFNDLKRGDVFVWGRPCQRGDSDLLAMKTEDGLVYLEHGSTIALSAINRTHVVTRIHGTFVEDEP